MSKVVEVMLHQQWKPRDRYGNGGGGPNSPSWGGIVVFWVGTALFEARYRVWADLLEVTAAHLGRADYRVTCPNTVGFPVPPGTPANREGGGGGGPHAGPDKRWVEAVITERLAPVLTACVDGRG